MSRFAVLSVAVLMGSFASQALAWGQQGGVSYEEADRRVETARQNLVGIYDGDSSGSWKRDRCTVEIQYLGRQRMTPSFDVPYFSVTVYTPELVSDWTQLRKEDVTFKVSGYFLANSYPGRGFQQGKEIGDTKYVDLQLRFSNSVQLDGAKIGIGHDYGFYGNDTVANYACTHLVKRR